MKKGVRFLVMYACVCFLNNIVYAQLAPEEYVASVSRHTTTQKLARKIMGKNFFGVEEAIKHFGVEPTPAQLSYLAKVPFAEAELREAQDTHVLIAVFPLSILEIRGKVKRELFYRYKDVWYDKQAFAEDHGDVGWYLIRKTPVENSTNSTWQEQQELLVRTEETPTARVMTYAIIGHYLMTDERLFAKISIRCSDTVLIGHQVYIGRFDWYGLDFYHLWNNDRGFDLGVSSARKPN